jgi:lipopolysaccharide heptosyltransferase II
MAGLVGPAHAVVAAWSHVKRILCVRLDNLGDVLMTTPALRAIRESMPRARITLLASPSGARAAAHLPEVDDVISHDAPWMKKACETEHDTGALIERLRERRFDAAIIFSVYTQSVLPAAFACWLASIPLRLAHCRENPYQLLTDWIPDPEPAERRHEVRRQLDLVAAVGCRTSSERLSFRTHASDILSARLKLRHAGVDIASPWIIIHPGATAPSRRYPSENFGVAASLIAERARVQIVLTGSAEEASLIEIAQARMCRRSFSLAGELTLGELAAVIAGAQLLIANNTGPVHLAAALETPVVDLYALTNPQHAPWGVLSRVLSHDVPCKYCYKSICPQTHHDCLRLIEPSQVADAAMELLSLSRTRADERAAAATRGHPTRTADVRPMLFQGVRDTKE